MGGWGRETFDAKRERRGGKGGTGEKGRSLMWQNGIGLNKNTCRRSQSDGVK